MVLPCIVSNTLYAVATVWYAYITHLGYRGKGIHPFYLFFCFCFCYPLFLSLFLFLSLLTSHLHSRNFFSLLCFPSLDFTFLTRSIYFQFFFFSLHFLTPFLIFSIYSSFFFSSAVFNQHSSFSLVSNNCCHFTVDRIDDPPYFWNSF